MAGEADIKALDKRIGGIERKLDELDKSLRAAGDFKGLEARVKTLEAICKTLMEARTASKAEAAKMIADVALLNKQALTKETVDKLLVQESAARTKEAEATARSYAEKARADAEATTRKIIEQQFKTIVEARLSAVEAMAKAALAKK